MAGSVPYLYTHGSTSFQWNGLGCELDANCWTFLLRQLSFNVATQQMRLANIGVSQQDNLEDKVVVIVVPRVHVYCYLRKNLNYVFELLSPLLDLFVS